MYTPSFISCRAKLERAKEHRDALDDYITTTFEVEANRPKFKLETGEHVGYVSAMPDLDPFLVRCAVIVGDAIHNLRSGLDHLVFQLALANTGGMLPDERRVQFPIEDDAARFERRCDTRNPHDRGAWIADLRKKDQAVLERFQPYNEVEGQQHPFAALRELSATDKHRLLSPVVIPPTRIEKANLMLGQLVNEHVRRSRAEFGRIKSDYVKLGAELFHARLPDTLAFQMDVAGYIVPHLTFRSGNTSIVAAIDTMSVLAAELIGEFDSGS